MHGLQMGNVLEISEEVESDESAEGVKTNAEADLSAVFEPSALSSFGKIPASHVLVHLLHAVLRLMQGHVNVYESAKEKDISRSMGRNTSVTEIPTQLAMKIQ